MSEDTVKKIAVIVLTALTVSLFLFLYTFFCFFNMGVVADTISFVIMLALSVTMIYLAKERLDEINGGQDNDVEHY